MPTQLDWLIGEMVSLAVAFGAMLLTTGDDESSLYAKIMGRITTLGLVSAIVCFLGVLLNGTGV